MKEFDMVTDTMKQVVVAVVIYGLALGLYWFTR